MFTHYRTQGIIIKKTDRGEADQLLTVYTADFGKIEVLGRAIRKIASKLRPGAELFYLSEIEFIQGRSYKTLTDAIALERFSYIRKSLGRLRIGCVISGLVDEFVGLQEADERLNNLINEVFYQLNSPRIKSVQTPLLYFYFFWNLVALLGYGPDFYSCVSCQKKLAPYGLSFSIRDGGILCQVCFSKSKKIGTINVTSEALDFIKLALGRNLPAASGFRLTLDSQAILTDLSRNYLRHILHMLHK